MIIEYVVLIGYANGDIHSVQVMKDHQASQLATTEASEIGTLANAGFRTVVASAWVNREMRTAGFLYAAAWNGSTVDILLHFGDKIASSEDLFLAIESQHLLTAEALLDFCLRSKTS